MLTDISTSALELARTNAEANGVAARVSVSQLNFMSPGSSAAAAEHLARPFDLVVASDLLYDGKEQVTMWRGGSWGLDSKGGWCCVGVLAHVSSLMFRSGAWPRSSARLLYGKGNAGPGCGRFES